MKYLDQQHQSWSQCWWLTEPYLFLCVLSRTKYYTIESPTPLVNYLMLIKKKKRLTKYALALTSWTSLLWRSGILYWKLYSMIRLLLRPFTRSNCHQAISTWNSMRLPVTSQYFKLGHFHKRRVIGDIQGSYRFDWSHPQCAVAWVVTARSTSPKLKKKVFLFNVKSKKLKKRKTTRFRRRKNNNNKWEKKR